MNNFLDFGLISELIPLPFTIMSIGFRKMRGLIMEETIKNVNKKELFNYLIENRIFLESLTYEDIKHYKKIFTKIKNQRFNQKIKEFFKCVIY